ERGRPPHRHLPAAHGRGRAAHLRHLAGGAGGAGGRRAVVVRGRGGARRAHRPRDDRHLLRARARDPAQRTGQDGGGRRCGAGPGRAAGARCARRGRRARGERGPRGRLGEGGLMSAVTSMPPVAPQERGRTAEQATRLAVLWVPDWPVVAAVTEGLAEAHLPVALHDGRGLVAVSAQARAEGVRRGMRRRTAQGVCPELVLVAADEGRDVRAFEPVMQALEEVAPDVLLLRPGVAVLPARGPVRYLGSEAALAELLVGAAAEVGAEAQVGLADGVLAAMLAAREQVHVPPGRSAEFLARRDVRDLVHVTTTRDSRARLVELVDLFRRLGLATLGDVARLRPAHVGPRFGGLGLQAHRLAEELQASMLRRGVVCARLRVHARTEDGGSLERSWRLDGGALTAAELTDRVRWQLEG